MNFRLHRFGGHLCKPRFERRTVWHRWPFQVVVPSKSISICTTSGCVIGGGGLPTGMFIFTACVWIGIVMISMISNTSITSISGVVLMSTITSGSALPPPEDTSFP
jgi:hypothetical protein